MTEQNKEISTSEILSDLDALATEFNQAAWQKGYADKRVAQTLEAAAKALRAERQKNADLQLQLNTASPALKKLKGKNFTFLIDGSGSMTSITSNYALKRSLNGIDAFLEATQAAGTIGLWGSSQVYVVGQDATRAQIEKGLNCGTDFAPAVNYMQTVTTAAKTAQRFVVLSDGDIYDVEKSEATVRALFSDTAKTSVDFVILSPQKNTGMERFARTLQQEFPEQVGIQTVANDQFVQDTLTKLATQRVPAPTKKAAAKKAPKA